MRFFWRRSRQYSTELILPYLKMRGKKPLLKQIVEIYVLTKKYRWIPHHYFRELVYLKSRDEPFDAFVPPRILRTARDALNAAGDLALVGDKVKFYNHMREHSFPTAALLFWTDADGAPLLPDGAPLDRRTAVDMLRKEGETVFAKPIDGVRGRDCGIVDAANVQSPEFKFPPNFVYQEFISQHPVIANIHPSSINTVRIDTTILDGELSNSAAVLRVGANRSVFDNIAASGGFCVGIDLQTGTLFEKGYRYPKHGGGPLYEHPDTGVAFGGTKVPFWPEVLDLVERAARSLEPLKTLGWDVAITPDGPLLIEANEDWDVTLTELGYGGLAETDFGRYAVAQFQARAA